MKRMLCTVVVFASCAVIAANQSSRGQGLGPGEKGATLRLPGAEPPAPGAAPSPWSDSPFTPGLVPSSGKKVAELPANRVEINKDVEITDKQGPWVIYVMSYSGPEAPQFAREFVAELRNNFKLNAYVYNAGAKEKQKEYERVQKIRQDQIDALQKAGLKGEYVPPPVRAVKIDEQTAVLVDGGFRSRDEALAMLTKLRAMTLPKDFAQRVKLDIKMLIVEEQDKTTKNGVKLGGHQAVLVNPFVRAFPARNPESKNHETTQLLEPAEVELIRVLNKQEPFSLLQTKKPYSLVIKQYNTQQVLVRNKKDQEAFERYRNGLFKKEGDWSDQAALAAHNLAEAFRKSGLAETFVLHTKYCSFVTVGSYDSLEDSRLATMQNFLESRFQMDAYRQLELMPRPMPLPVPR